MGCVIRTVNDGKRHQFYTDFRSRRERWSRRLLEVGVTESSGMEGRVYALVLFRVGPKCFSVMADGKKYIEGVESREARIV